ncbi:flagellin [Marinobacter sp.]|uniref:flagellin N-terminal helical domain-containing protein n=1 Tax=Marinobacter sp. TaxID=50741 RepID=UPI0019B90021|nr:flagellin [Marinobacter sp.]MBC7192371.1 flagellin [Marinobacter sp.]
MALGINTNVASLSAQNQLSNSQKLNDQALERLSSGLRINSAKDDAAGLAISTRFSAQISGLNVAQRNANDGISYAQTAEGALGEITNALQRIRDLSVQSVNSTNSSSDRAALDQEVTALKDEIERISQSTQFNGQNILDGTLSDLTFQVGANEGQVIKVSGVDSRTSQLGASVATGTAVKDFTNGADGSGDLTIDGGNGEGATAIDVNGLTSLDQVVDAINAKTETTGVTAQREAEVSQKFTVADAGADVTIKINGTDVALTSGDDENDIAEKINAAGAGVKAEVSATDEITITSQDTKFTLTDADADAGGTGTAFIFGTTDQSGTFESGIKLTGAVGNTIAVGGDQDAAYGLDSLTASQSKLSTLSVADPTSAASAITTVDFALDQINSLRAELGAVQNRFESTISNIASTSENLSAANSRILDADFASETAKLAKSQVLQQAGISVLAQANARPQQVLSLLQ